MVYILYYSTYKILWLSSTSSYLFLLKKKKSHCQEAKREKFIFDHRQVCVFNSSTLAL